MSRPLLPPRGIFASTRLLFDQRLSGNLKETTLQLMALAWGSSDFRTPPLSMAQLSELTGKDMRTLRGHLLALRKLDGVLSMQRIQQGVLTITLASWLFRNDAPGPAWAQHLPPANQRLAMDDLLEASAAQSGAKDQAGGGPPAGGEKPAVDQRSASARAQSAVGRRTRSAAGAQPPTCDAPTGRTASGRGAARALTKKLQAELLERGLFPVLLAEVAASSYSEADLRALLAWCSADSPERPAGLFMGRLRAGARAPKVYRGVPCSVCGQYGKHAADCRKRFSQDIYNSG